MTISDPVPQLRAVLTDDSSPNLALRFRALFSLKHLAVNGSTSAIDAIAAAFASDSALLKHELAYCLGQSKQFYAAPYLQNVLSNESEDAMVRHEAGEALGALGHEPSLPLLRKYKDDKEEVIAQTCELAIARIEWEISEQRNKEKLEQSAFASIDPAPPLPIDEDGEREKEGKIEKLKDVLNDQNKPLFERYRAMFRLRDIATPEAIDALASGLDDPSALFRHEIAFVFGQLSDPHSIPALIKAAGNKNEASMVRHEAVEALGSIADERVDAFLKEYAKDEERVVRESAEVALDMAEYERSGQLDYALIPNATEAKA
ncbi:ARM repeat-containing protein [Ascodesmis nigricans]|uniref:Deoxyhypusine hydroxylase n=1 Tax=Ascodesmis nigricans TaxID=341454 RepID=A0A4S2N722_9PEZI|nr:ARM repeat-containing protein [Ascodesmis nigricans]